MALLVFQQLRRYCWQPPRRVLRSVDVLGVGSVKRQRRQQQLGS